MKDSEALLERRRRRSRSWRRRLSCATTLAILLGNASSRATGLTDVWVGAGGFARSIGGPAFDGNHVVSVGDTAFVLPKLDLGVGIRLDLGVGIRSGSFLYQVTIGYAHGWWNGTLFPASGAPVAVAATSNHLPMEIDLGYFSETLGAAFYGALGLDLAYMQVPSSRASGIQVGTPPPSLFIGASRQDAVELSLGAGVLKNLGDRFFVNGGVFVGTYRVSKVGGYEIDSSGAPSSVTWVARLSAGVRFDLGGGGGGSRVIFGQCHCQYRAGDAPPTSCSDPRCGPASW
jgi:hypothetical protein